MTVYTDAITAVALLAGFLFCCCLSALALWLHGRAYIELQRGRAAKLQNDASEETLDASTQALDEIDRGRRFNRDAREQIPDDDLRQWARDDGPLTEEEIAARYHSTDDNAEHLGDEGGADTGIPAGELYNAP